MSVKPVGYLELRRYIKEKNMSDELNRKQVVQLENAIFYELSSVESAKCSKCPRTENLTLDHIVPKVILQSFGVDVSREVIEGNYQLLCKSCNVFKGGKLDFSIPITKEIIHRLLEKL